MPVSDSRALAYSKYSEMVGVDSTVSINYKLFSSGIVAALSQFNFNWLLAGQLYPVNNS